MTAFAQTLQRQQQEAAAIQTSERTKRRVVRRSPVVVEPSEPAESPDDVFDDEHDEPGAFPMAVSPKTEQPALPATVTPAPQPAAPNWGRLTTQPPAPPSACPHWTCPPSFSVRGWTAASATVHC